MKIYLMDHHWLIDHHFCHQFSSGGIAVFLVFGPTQLLVKKNTTTWGDIQLEGLQQFHWIDIGVQPLFSSGYSGSPKKKRGGLWFISGRRETRNYSELVLGPKQVQAILSETGFDSDFVEASVAGRAEVMNFWSHEMMRKVVKILGYFRIRFSDKGIRWFGDSRYSPWNRGHQEFHHWNIGPSRIVSSYWRDAGTQKGLK